MWLNTLWRRWLGRSRPLPLDIPRRTIRQRPTPRPYLEALEDRTLLSNYSAASATDLIADINQANTNGGSNTITLTANISLSSVANTTNGANGLPVIALDDQLTLAGGGFTIERSTSAGTPAFRLLDVANGASLTLQNLTLTNGLAFGSVLRRRVGPSTTVGR